MKFIEQLRSARANTPEEHELLAMLIRREEKREKNGLNALMEKFKAARAAGFELNERDSSLLLALLLDEVLERTV